MRDIYSSKDFIVLAADCKTRLHDTRDCLNLVPTDATTQAWGDVRKGGGFESRLEGLEVL